MENLAVLLACFVPFGLFAAGWFSCYLLVVKYRLRFERRPDLDEGGSFSTAPEWQP
jgi:hypothetical protein